MKLKLLAMLIIVVGFCIPTNAQLDKQSKKNIKKSTKLYKKRKYEESASYVKQVLQQYPLNEKLWKYYQEIYYQNYEENYKPQLNFKIESEDDSLAFLLQKAVTYVIHKPKWDYINAVNDASMYSPYNAHSSIMMRDFYVDKLYYSDSKVSAKSKAYFEKAEGEFGSKNYEKAIGYYEKAIAEDSSNYKAFLYLGDTYYAMEYYGKAADYFRQAIVMNPNLLEPIKYLADALIKKEEYEQALEVLKESFLVYPEEGMYIKLYDVLETIGKQQLDRNWILRKATIARVENESRRVDFFDDLAYFQYYSDAARGLKEEFDKNGIAKDSNNANTYYEIACWKEMLKSTTSENAPELNYAREMDKKGLLEPYVFINLFNVDLYPQFKHFANNNAPLLKQYINNYLIVERQEE